MSRKTGLYLACLAAAALFASSARAHEFLVKIATPNPKAGAEIDARLHNTHTIIGASEEETGENEADAVIAGSGTLEPLGLRDDPATLTTKILGAVPSADTGWLAVHRKPQLWSQTTDGMLRTDNGTAGGAKILFTDKYEKFAKVLLNARADNDVHRLQVGHALEIVPEANPATLKPGGVVRVKTYHDGKPVAAEYLVGRDGALPDGSSHDLEPENAGVDGLDVRIDRPGFWVVIAKIQVPGGDGVRNHYLNAALEFEVR